MNAQKIYDWIMERLEDGMDVYASTYTHSFKITKKYRECVRVNGLHCEIQRGKRWVSINGCKITAQEK